MVSRKLYCANIPNALEIRICKSSFTMAETPNIIPSGRVTTQLQIFKKSKFFELNPYPPVSV